jgi:hypothetical protein
VRAAELTAVELRDVLITKLKELIPSAAVIVRPQWPWREVKAQLEAQETRRREALAEFARDA